jgi:hypothetical protein
MPFFIYISGGSEYFFDLAFISFFSTISVFFGYYVSFNFGVLKNTKLVICPRLYFKLISIFFYFFVFFIFYFDGVPLISALLGDIDSDLIRGEFFKGREGFEQVLVYIGALLTYIFVPMAVLIAYQYKISGKYFFVVFSILYCVLTLQKALLLNLLLPIFYYLVVNNVVSFKKVIIIIFLLVVYFVIIISFTVDNKIDGDEFSMIAFFSANYMPSSAFEFFVWRVFSVPIYTAADTLVVFDKWMNSQLLMGGSSSALSALLGVKHVDIEKIVFEYQFGGFNLFANANAYFAVGLFTDFGYVGLLSLSFLLGMGFAMVDKTRSVVLSSMAFLLVYLLFNASMIGTLLSAGYVYLFFHALFIKFKEYK